MAKKNQLSLKELEASMDELSEIVKQMESGPINLENSLALFERGIALTRQCQHTLKAVEQKIEILTRENGKDVLTAFEES
jgi:exodeoxyribonuclease VII small subunit